MRRLTLQNPKQKNILFDSIYEFQLNSIEFKPHVMSLSILIQIKLNFHKINSLQ
jgi:hypothetical protein